MWTFGLNGWLSLLWQQQIQTFSVAADQTCTTVRRNSGPLFMKLFKFSNVPGKSGVSHSFEVMSQRLDQVEVRTLTGPQQTTLFLLSKPFCLICFYALGRCPAASLSDFWKSFADRFSVTSPSVRRWALAVATPSESSDSAELSVFIHTSVVPWTHEHPGL